MLNDEFIYIWVLLLLLKVIGRQVMDVEKEEEEMMMMKRMDFEINDYPGSGANNRHDPKTPAAPWISSLNPLPNYELISLSSYLP